VTNLESRGWERREREGGWECVCKRDRVGDGRECESVRESRWWHRELVRDGRERDCEIKGWESVRDGRESVSLRESSRGWERE
jgi:hypothetical protein